MRVLVLSLAVLFASIACSNPQKEELDTIYKSLVKDHDEVMPKTMGINSVREKMIKAAETAGDSTMKQALDISSRLSNVEETMDTWMVEFGDAIKLDDKDSQKLNLYKILNEQIIKLKTDTDSAISDAKSLTASLTVEQ